MTGKLSARATLLTLDTLSPVETSRMLLRGKTKQNKKTVFYSSRSPETLLAPPTVILSPLHMTGQTTLDTTRDLIPEVLASRTHNYLRAFLPFQTVVFLKWDYTTLERWDPNHIHHFWTEWGEREGRRERSKKRRTCSLGSVNMCAYTPNCVTGDTWCKEIWWHGKDGITDTKPQVASATAENETETTKL